MSIELTIWPPLIVPFVRTIVLCVDVPDEDLITELVQQGPADLEPVSLPPDIHPMVIPLPPESSAEEAFDDDKEFGVVDERESW